jgi:ABC-type nitrate/sulfonate/bicarbonate transport system substrate-binding protein
VYLRGWSWAKANPEEARRLGLDFYKQGGLEVSSRALDQEFALRPTFGLDEQLKLMARNEKASTVDAWFNEIGKFIAEVGTIPSTPEARTYLSDEYLKRVAADPKLRAFATEFDKK